MPHDKQPPDQQQSKDQLSEEEKQQLLSFMHKINTNPKMRNALLYAMEQSSKIPE